jgi:hypothetical protein
MMMLVLCQGAVAQKTTQPPNYTQDVVNTGTAAAAFLQIGVGARAQSMGAAFVSLANDANAMYWNPAGISRLGQIEATFSHTNWLADTKFDYAGFTVPLGSFGAVGVNFTIFDYGEQPVRTVAQPEGTGETYGSRDIAIGVSFAMNLTDRFSFGFNGKYINQKIWNEFATGAAIDFGALYETPLRGLKLGVSISNFGTDMKLDGRDLLRAYDPDPLNYGNDAINVNYKTDPFALPLLFRFGISYKAELDNNNQFTLATDVLHPSNNSESINLGAEYMLFNTVALRVGYENLFEKDRINGLTFGGGLYYTIVGRTMLKVDYAYSDWGILKNAQRLTVGLVF